MMHGEHMWNANTRQKNKKDSHVIDAIGQHKEQEYECAAGTEINRF